jgi:lipopolysaccharide biosynthesis glycosyltransferase
MIKVEKMIISLCIDDNYFEQACAVIRSIEHHNKNIGVKVYVIGLNLNNENIAKLASMNTEYLKVEHVASDISIFQNFAIDGHLSHATYVKLAIPSLLASESKVLYLDADLIVTAPLQNIWNTDITNKPLAGVVNPLCDRNAAIFMDAESQYFNAGVMLLNLDYFREFNLAEKAYDFMVNHKKRAVFHDQDALNHAVNGNWVELGFEFNFQTFFLRMFHRFSTQMKTKILTSAKYPVIIHFSSGMKPWEQFDPHPLKKEFLKFYQGEISTAPTKIESIRNLVRYQYVKLYYFWQLKILVK